MAAASSLLRRRKRWQLPCGYRQFGSKFKLVEICEGLPSIAKTGSSDAKSVDLGSMGLGDLETVDLETVNLETVNLGTVGLGTVSLGTVGLETVVTSEARSSELYHTGHCHENAIIISEHFQFYYQVGALIAH